MTPLCQMQNLVSNEELQELGNDTIFYVGRRMIVQSSYYKSIFTYSVSVQGYDFELWISMDDALKKEDNFIRFELNSNFYFGFDALVTRAFKKEAVIVIDDFSEKFLSFLDQKFKTSPFRLHAVTCNLLQTIERNYGRNFDFINHIQIQKGRLPISEMTEELVLPPQEEETH